MGGHRLTQWKPPGVGKSVHTAANGRKLRDNCVLTGVTEGWGLLRYLRPGEPTPRSEVWTLVPQSQSPRKGQRLKVELINR